MLLKKVTPCTKRTTGPRGQQVFNLRVRAAHMSQQSLSPKSSTNEPGKLCICAAVRDDPKFSTSIWGCSKFDTLPGRHLHICKYLYPHTYTYTCTCIHTYIYVRTLLYTYIYAYIHTCRHILHTYLQIHAYATVYA